MTAGPTRPVTRQYQACEPLPQTTAMALVVNPFAARPMYHDVLTQHVGYVVRDARTYREHTVYVACQRGPLHVDVDLVIRRDHASQFARPCQNCKKKRTP